MKKKQILKVAIRNSSKKLLKLLELPSLQGIDAIVSAWLLLGYRVEFYVVEIEESEDENK